MSKEEAELEEEGAKSALTVFSWRGRDSSEMITRANVSATNTTQPLQLCYSLTDTFLFWSKSPDSFHKSGVKSKTGTELACKLSQGVELGK